MRIVSGKLKSRRINTPKNLPVRPTTDMAKEALFNILNNTYYLDDINVLDLFSGTGNISYEFHSRGSIEVTAVEQDSKCVNFIRKTIDSYEMDNIQVFQADCFNFIKTNNKKYDIIFADPPYDMPNYPELVNLIFEKDLLTDDGLLIVEHSKKTDLSIAEQFTKRRKYGGVNFSFFNKTTEE